MEAWLQIIESGNIHALDVQTAVFCVFFQQELRKSQANLSPRKPTRLPGNTSPFSVEKLGLEYRFT